MNTLPGLKPMHVKAEPHTLTLDTTEPFSAFKIIKYPSTEPATRAVPNGWKVSDTHSYVIYLNTQTIKCSE